MRLRLTRQREILTGIAAELLRHAERIEGAEPVPELEQMGIFYREERARERREDRQLVVGSFDRGERRTHGFDFFPAVKRLSSHEQMRNASRLDSVRIGSRDVFAEVHETAKQDGDVARPDRNTLLGAIRTGCGDLPDIRRIDEPGNERSDGVGQRFFDGPR